MAKHHPDLIFCRKQPGVAIGRLCEKCDGKCVICDSYVRPCTLVRICDECNYGSYQGRCVICGGPGAVAGCGAGLWRGSIVQGPARGGRQEPPPCQGAMGRLSVGAMAVGGCGAVLCGGLLVPGPVRGESHHHV